MTEPSAAHDPEAVRVGRLFADLMLTLAEDGVRGAEAVTLTAPLSAALQTIDLTAEPVQPPRLCPESTVAGLTMVCGLLADQLVAERRAPWAGQLPGDGLERAARDLQSPAGCDSTG